jgi:hypothetical protein
MPPVHIHHHIATIRIDNDSDCWAAATAMVMRRHSAAGTDHVKSLVRSARIPLEADGTIPDSSVQLRAIPRAPLTLRDLEGLLQRGPVAAFGFFNIENVPVALQHAVAMYSLIGDGTSQRTTLNLIDPKSSMNPCRYSWERFDLQIADITHLLHH